MSGVQLGNREMIEIVGVGTSFGAICRHMLGLEAGVNAKKMWCNT